MLTFCSFRLSSNALDAFSITRPVKKSVIKKFRKISYATKSQKFFNVTYVDVHVHAALILRTKIHERFFQKLAPNRMDTKIIHPLSHKKNNDFVVERPLAACHSG